MMFLLIAFWMLAVFMLVRDAWKHKLGWTEEHEAGWAWGRDWKWRVEDNVLGISLDGGFIIKRYRHMGFVTLSYTLTV